MHSLVAMSACPMSTPPAKRKKHMTSMFQMEWSRFRMVPSRKGASFAFCTLYGVDISVTGGGVHEVKRHCESTKHKHFLDGMGEQPNISCAMAKGRQRI